MAEFTKVCKVGDIAAGSGKVAEVGGQQVAVFNVEGNFHAINNICKHRGGPLGEGYLEGAIVTCPLHSWQYDVTTGACETNPAVSIECYPVKVEGEDILVEA